MNSIIGYFRKPNRRRAGLLALLLCLAAALPAGTETAPTPKPAPDATLASPGQPAPKHRPYTDTAPYFKTQDRRYSMVQPGAPAVVDYTNGPADNNPAGYGAWNDNALAEDDRVWVEQHTEEVAHEEPIPGQYIMVFHPAIYRQRDDGRLAEVEPERTTREPKTRIVLTRQFIAGHAEYPSPGEDRGTNADLSGNTHSAMY